MDRRTRWKAVALALAASGLFAGCEDRRAPKLDEPGVREQGHEVDRAGGVERPGDHATTRP